MHRMYSSIAAYNKRVNKERAHNTKEGKAERASRFFRNVHALGAVAFVGAGIALMPLAPIFETVAAIEAVHAGGWEVARHHFAKRRTRKS